MNQIEVLHNISDITESDWEQLRKTSQTPNFQLSFKLIKNWFELNDKYSPVILSESTNGTINTLLPLMKTTIRRRRILKQTILRYAAFSATDFSTILAPVINTEQAVNKTLSFLYSNQIHWDKMLLDNMEQGNPIIESLQTWLDAQAKPYKKTSGKYYYIDLSQSWDDILKDTSKKYVRRTINQSKNRANRLGEWRVLINPEMTVDEILNHAKQMHIDRQKELSRQSLFVDPVQELIYKNTVDYFIKNNMFRTYWLELNGELIAYLFCILENNKIYAWNMAFNPDHAFISPSRILLYDLLQYLNQHNYAEFHFMRGETDYKTKWTKTYRENISYHIYNCSHLTGKLNYFLDQKKANA